MPCVHNFEPQKVSARVVDAIGLFTTTTYVVVVVGRLLLCMVIIEYPMC